MGKIKECKEIIEFGDDFGENSCTFHCELIKNHKGNHRATGELIFSDILDTRQKYIVEWKDMK
ncbi:MAG: hypothetical protein KAT68_19585 [Bacteroidales bacterium]|nr:hypothetical protein [Bacteroidales bacterium]